MQVESQDTEHIRAEQRIALLTRLYITLSDVNATVVRARDRGATFFFTLSAADASRAPR